jgi:sulfatase modifying factor 1
MHADMIEVPAPDGKTTYCIDKTEVTNKAYAAWLATSPPIAGQPPECAWNMTLTPSTDWPADGKDDLPVAYVDWCDAHAYCAGIGKRLCGQIGGGATVYAEVGDPAKDQWYNACSNAGANLYPYGATYDKAACNGEDTVGSTEAVGSHTKCVGGFDGLLDMSGNVWEWEDACSGATGEADQCRRRGGSYSSGPALLACDVKGDDPRSAADNYIGIRCCLD